MKGYFSRIRMRPNLGLHPGVVRTLSEGYGLHKSLWQLFRETGLEKRDFLYRQVDDQSGSPTFYTVSLRPPTSDDDIWAVETKLYEPELNSGDRLAFSLRASATCCVKDPITGKERRHDVVMHQLKQAPGKFSEAETMQQAGIEWLSARAEGFGFHLVQAVVRSRMQHRLFPKGKPSPIRFTTMDFEGTLEVDNPVVFQKTLFHGIGKAKGFGCGMLLIKRR